MDADLSKENMVVVDSVAHTKILICLQYELINKRQLARHFKSTLDQINTVPSSTNYSALNNITMSYESIARDRYSLRNVPMQLCHVHRPFVSRQPLQECHVNFLSKYWIIPNSFVHMVSLDSGTDDKFGHLRMRWSTATSLHV